MAELVLDVQQRNTFLREFTRPTVPKRVAMHTLRDSGLLGKPGQFLPKLGRVYPISLQRAEDRLVAANA
jgi:hypothetical protein